MDVFELKVPTKNIKIKVLLVMDLATRFRATIELHRYPLGEMRNETAEEVLKALGVAWLQHHPKPSWWLTDSAKSFESH